MTEVVARLGWRDDSEDSSCLGARGFLAPNQGGVKDPPNLATLGGKRPPPLAFPQPLWGRNDRPQPPPAIIKRNILSILSSDVARGLWGRSGPPSLCT
eukprot:scaffold6437_cov101-Isochrysis_galbana.AAC.1